MVHRWSPYTVCTSKYILMIAELCTRTAIYIPMPAERNTCSAKYISMAAARITLYCEPLMVFTGTPVPYSVFCGKHRALVSGTLSWFEIRGWHRAGPPVLAIFERSARRPVGSPEFPAGQAQLVSSPARWRTLVETNC